MTTTDTPTPLESVPATTRDEQRRLSEIEYRRIIEALAVLDADDWARPTDCDGWTVRDLAGHVLGSMRSAASIRHSLAEQLAVKRRAKRLGGPLVDHMTAIQVETTAGLATSQLLDEGRLLIEAAAEGRRKVPTPIRRLAKIPVDVPGLSETWTLDYLLGPILTRDTWMHRVDLARATGRPMELTAGHDGRIVADVAREWAERHGRPVELHLTGVAGGQFVAGPADPSRDTIELDAVEFCRIVSMRAPGEGLLAQPVPF